MDLRNSKVANGLVSIALALAGGLVLFWEGTRYTAYQDSGGVWTICQGHTKGVKKGDTATPAQCDQYRAADLADADSYVSQCITSPLTDNVRAAFLDAAFNLGPSVVCGSTLQRKANAGDIKGACEELSRWVHAGGVVLKGLQNRRAAEIALCWPSFANVEAATRSTAAFAPKDS